MMNEQPGTPASVPGPAGAHASEPSPPDPGSSQAEIDREVADAMAHMTLEDLDELSGGLNAPVAVRRLEKGAEVTGTVVATRGEDVFLDFGVKDQGVVPRNHFGKNEDVSTGRRVDVVVERHDESQGLWVCSRKGAVQRATWLNLDRGMTVEGRVTGLNKGGLEVDVQGIRAFLPASQVDLHFMKDISVLIGEVVHCEVTEVDRRGKNLLLSRRRVLEKEAAEKKAVLLTELEIGQVRTGRVRNVTDFGAFVDLGGVEGLIHISDLSWRPVGKVTDIVDVGQEVEVKVLKIDRERDRISLGLKQARPDPWTGIETRLQEGMSLRAKVLRVADFGAFAEVEEGVEGLIPISEMSWSRISSVADAVKVGDEVDVTVLRLEPGKRRMALSMKQARPDPWAGVIESYAPGMTVKGTVSRLETFGVFVAVAPGVEGMIHISELSDKRVRTCDEVVKVGQEVDARVLSVDGSKRRIALSLKPAHGAAPEAIEAGASGRRAERKDRPRRGGLSSDWDWMGSGLGRG